MKLLSRCLIPITICLILVISSIPVFANTGNYEYNSYVLHVAGGNVVRNGAFWSDNSDMSSFDIYINTSNGYWNITGSTYSSPVPKPNGYKLGSIPDNTYYAEVNGTKYYFNHVTQTSMMVAYNIPAAPNYPVINIYLPYVVDDGSSGGGGGTNPEPDEPIGIPETPILRISNGTSVSSLTWQPTGYPAKILYSSDGHEYSTVEDNVTTVNYLVSNEGFYRVQLHYTVDGNNYLTDVSNKVECVLENEYEDDGVLGAIWKLLSDIIDGIDNAISTLGQFITNIGEFIKTLVSWLPDEVSSVFFAVVIVGLVLGLFLK